MKIATYNVNGMRARMEHLLHLLQTEQPDIVGLQETKVADELFPAAQLAELGYHSICHGQPGHYGVALLSRHPFAHTARGWPHDGAEAQRRMVRATMDTPLGPLQCFCGYFPQGQNRAHPHKFPAKRKFYRDLHEHLGAGGDGHRLVMGDFNVAPTDADVGIGDQNRKRWLREGKCAFLPEEREWLQALHEHDLTDPFVHLHDNAARPAAERIYSWFDYRSRGFDDTPRRGLRIDYHLVSRSLLPHCRAVRTLYAMRAMPRPSDHCPVILDLKTP